MNSTQGYDHILLEIRRRLHDPRGRKAAVMVGAGFSRNARHRSGSRKRLPDWKTLTLSLVKKLYLDPKDQADVLEAAGATSAAARLAQEFETAFGRPGLIALIRDEIRDDEFLPGALHKSLLELPWADVFTTNYDRLLERAAGILWKQYYETVAGMHDLPLVRRPRIVKLHGTLPDLDQLILTEDDYRKYPRTHAPFVAAVQASLTENILCLIGFSGTDPNFLAWTGWLRDEMRVATPNTYLFTVEPLKPFQRQLLEDRHIVPVPIDLLPNLDKPASYEEAYEWLFAELAKSPDQPTAAWNDARRYVGAGAHVEVVAEPFSPHDVDLIDTAVLWREHRLQFKGWSVLPRESVDRLWLRTDNWTSAVSQVAVSAMPPQTALFVIRELVWRWSAALQPLYDQFVFNVLDPELKRFAAIRSSLVEKTIDVVGKSKQLNVSVLELDEAYEMLLRESLRHSREVGDDVRFESIGTNLDSLHASLAAEAAEAGRAYVAHQRILHALGRLQHGKARQLLETWDTSTCDPIWSARRGALCLECGQVELGTRLLEEALLRVRSVPPSSGLNIANLSVEGIALNLLHIAYWAQRVTRSEPSNESSLSKVADEPEILERLAALGAYGCDPSEFAEWLEQAVSVEPRAVRGAYRQDSFDIGRMNQGVSMGSEPILESAYRAMRFMEDAGLPIQVYSVIRASAAAAMFRGAMRIVAFFAPTEAVGLFLRSRDKKITEELLSRKCIASLSDKQVQTLQTTGRNSLNEALGHLGVAPARREVEDDFWDDQFSVSCSLLGHVVVRLPEEEIGKLLRLLAPLPHDSRLVNRLQLQKALSECLWRISNCCSKEVVEELLPTLLETPVRGSSRLPESSVLAEHWLDPVAVAAQFCWDQNSKVASACKTAIDSLLVQIGATNGKERENLCVRCDYLREAGLLSHEQAGQFAVGLYARVDGLGMPTETGLWDFILLSIPQAQGRDEAAAFRSKYLDIGDGRPVWEVLRRTNTADPGSSRRRVGWTSEDIDRILELAGRWLPAAPPTDPKKASDHVFLMMSDDGPQRRRTFAHWLATIEEAVLLNDLSTEAQRKSADLLVVNAAQQGWKPTQALAARIKCGYVTEGEAAAEILGLLGSREASDVHQGLLAIERWHELLPSSELLTQLDQALSVVVTVHQHDHIAQFLRTLMHIIERPQGLSAATVFDSIRMGFKAILDETSYKDDSASSPWTLAEKLEIRVACAELAASIVASGLSDADLASWHSGLRADEFAEVRRSLGSRRF